MAEDETTGAALAQWVTDNPQEPVVVMLTARDVVNAKHVLELTRTFLLTQANLTGVHVAPALMVVEKLEFDLSRALLDSAPSEVRELEIERSTDHLPDGVREALRAQLRTPREQKEDGA